MIKLIYILLIIVLYFIHLYKNISHKRNVYVYNIVTLLNTLMITKIGGINSKLYLTFIQNSSFLLNKKIYLNNIIN